MALNQFPLPLEDGPVAGGGSTNNPGTQEVLHDGTLLHDRCLDDPFPTDVCVPPLVSLGPPVRRSVVEMGRYLPCPT